MKHLVSNGVVVGNKLKHKQDYKKKIDYCKLLTIGLDKCWICLEETLNGGHLGCGHFIHTRCAEQYFNMNNRFKCGICRKDYGAINGFQT